MTCIFLRAYDTFSSWLWNRRRHPFTSPPTVLTTGSRNVVFKVNLMRHIFLRDFALKYFIVTWKTGSCVYRRRRVWETSGMSQKVELVYKKVDRSRMGSDRSRSSREDRENLLTTQIQHSYVSTILIIKL